MKTIRILVLLFLLFNVSGCTYVVLNGENQGASTEKTVDTNAEAKIPLPTL